MTKAKAKLPLTDKTGTPSAKPPRFRPLSSHSCGAAATSAVCKGFWPGGFIWSLRSNRRIVGVWLYALRGRGAS